MCLQQALRDLQVAFSNFFDKRAAYPSFKRKEARQSANYTERGFSFDTQRRILKLAKNSTKDHRVFVRVMDGDGYLNARMIDEIRSVSLSCPCLSEGSIL